MRTEAGAMLGHVSAADAAKLAPLIDGGRIKVSARSRAAHSDVCGRAFDVRIKVRVASTCPFLTVDDARRNAAERLRQAGVELVAAEPATDAASRKRPRPIWVD